MKKALNIRRLMKVLPVYQGVPDKVGKNDWFVSQRLLMKFMGKNPEMCEAVKILMKDEIAQEKKAVEKETTERVAFDTILNIIKKMMKNQGQSAEEAMRVLEIPEREQKKYLAELHSCSENSKEKPFGNTIT